MASIATMPRVKPIFAVIGVVALLAAVSGCGGDEDPEPSISGESALALIGTLQEIQANVDNGSCLVAADKVGELIDEINALPSDVNEDVRDALERGAVNLRGLVDDPDQCAREEEATTTEETTTEETTTEETTTQETTTQETTTAPPTTTTTPTNPGGGVGPQGGVSP